MAPSPKHSRPASALIEVKPDRLGQFTLPLDRGDLFLLRLEQGQAELLAPTVPHIGRRYRVLAVATNLYNQRLALGHGHIVPSGRAPRIDIFGGELARLEFEIAGADERGRALTLVSGLAERWPRGSFRFAP